MSAFRMTQFLHHWQELSGAIIGGFMGVAGALIVAREALNRERRNASRMLQHDLLGITDAVSCLTYRRRVTLETVGTKKIAQDLSFYCPKLSPLFEVQMATISGIDVRLAALLSGFHTAYSAVESHVRTVQHSGIGTAPWARASEALPGVFQFADDYARAALYLLPLHEMGAIRRLYWRLRRWAWPDSDDKIMRPLVKRMTGAKSIDAESTEAAAAG